LSKFPRAALDSVNDARIVSLIRLAHENLSCVISTSYFATAPYGTAQPEYVVHSEDIMVKLSALPQISNRQSGGLDGGLADRIIAELKENPKITQKELVDNTDIPLRTIQRTLKELRENCVIDRKGGKRFGYWEVKD